MSLSFWPAFTIAPPAAWRSDAFSMAPTTAGTAALTAAGSTVSAPSAVSSGEYAAMKAFEYFGFFCATAGASMAARPTAPPVASAKASARVEAAPFLRARRVKIMW